MKLRRDEENAGHRHERVQGLILEELRALLRDEIADPVLTGIQVNAVVLSVDYRHARVHFALPPRSSPVDREAADRALVRASPFLRARLSEAIEMKRVPDLRFVFDASLVDD